MYKKNKKGTKILLVGCGQLGSRHLQAVASLKNISEIHVVDPAKGSLALGKQRLAEIKGINPDIKFQWFKSLNASSADGDICIIATQARERCKLVKKVVEDLGYKNFLIEKLVSQSVQEYEDLMEFSSQKDISVWVNCKTRAYGIHKYIKSRISQDAIIYSDIAGNHGLVTNGIHSLDLFMFYDGGRNIMPFGARINPKAYPSKRSAELFDLSGTLCGYSDRGSIFMLSFSEHYGAPGCLSVIGQRCRFIVDIFRKWAFESYADSDWQWQKISIDENWSVSHMTKRFMSDILNTGSCELPMLIESFPAHKFMLEVLLPHFNSLLKKDNVYCPVT